MVRLFAAIPSFGLLFGGGSVPSEQTMEKALVVVDKVEKTAVSVWEWSRVHRDSLKALSGVGLLLYGGKFSNTLLFAQALSVSGWPVIQQSLKDLVSTYKNTRDAIKAELPDIVKAKDNVAELAKKLQKYKSDLDIVQSSFDSGKISASDFQKRSQEAQTAMADLQASLKKVNAINSSISHIKEAVNPKHLQEIASAVYSTLLIGYAAVSSKTVATATMGMNMGKIAYDRATKVYDTIAKRTNSTVLIAAESYVSTHPEWTATGGKMIANALGVIAAAFLTRLAPTLSACTMGSHMLLNAAEEYVDPILEKMNLPTIKGSPQGVTIVQSTLMACGCRAQLLPGGAKMPGLVKLLVSPLLALELFLSKNIVKAAVKGA